MGLVLVFFEQAIVQELLHPSIFFQSCHGDFFRSFFALLFLLLMSLSLMIFAGVFESPDYFMYLLFHVFHPPRK